MKISKIITSYMNRIQNNKIDLSIFLSNGFRNRNNKTLCLNISVFLESAKYWGGAKNLYTEETIELLKNYIIE